MKPENQYLLKLREIVFDNVDFFDQEKMINKLDQLIHFWGRELVHKQYIDKIPVSDEAWLKFLGMDIYWGHLRDQWEHYVVGGLIFFVMLRADIKRDFLTNVSVLHNFPQEA